MALSLWLGIDNDLVLLRPRKTAPRKPKTFSEEWFRLELGRRKTNIKRPPVLRAMVNRSGGQEYLFPCRLDGRIIVAYRDQRLPQPLWQLIAKSFAHP